MNAKEVIAALSEHGISATESEVRKHLGQVLDSIVDSDIPGIVEGWPSVQNKADGGMVPSGGKLAKTRGKAKRDSITKLDQNNLPEVSSLNKAQLDTFISQIEEMEAAGEPLNDELMSLLGDLYVRRDQAIQFVRSTSEAFKAQDEAMAQAEVDLASTLNGSLQTLQSFNSLAEQLRNAEVNLGDTFRSNTAKQQASINKFMQRIGR